MQYDDAVCPPHLIALFFKQDWLSIWAHGQCTVIAPNACGTSLGKVTGYVGPHRMYEQEP